MNPSFRDDEVQRICLEYKRRESEIPASYYSSNNPGNCYIYSKIRQCVRRLLCEKIGHLSSKKILEVGCGSGNWLVDFKKWGSDSKLLHGIDLLKEQVLIAQQRLPEADLRQGDASRLPWQDQSFDIVLQSTVFSSILNREFKKQVALEMLRVLKVNGAIVWYDFFFNNPKNLNVRGVTQAEIKLLFPKCKIQVVKVTLAPPLARWLAPLSKNICEFLEQLRFLNTHYLAFIQKSNYL